MSEKEIGTIGQKELLSMLKIDLLKKLELPFNLMKRFLEKQQLKDGVSLDIQQCIMLMML